MLNEVMVIPDVAVWVSLYSVYFGSTNTCSLVCVCVCT